MNSEFLRLLLKILTSHKTVIRIKKDEGSIKTRLVAEIDWNGETLTVISAGHQDHHHHHPPKTPHTQRALCVCAPPRPPARLSSASTLTCC